MVGVWLQLARPGKGMAAEEVKWRGNNWKEVPWWWIKVTLWRSDRSLGWKSRACWPVPPRLRVTFVLLPHKLTNRVQVSLGSVETSCEVKQIVAITQQQDCPRSKDYSFGRFSWQVTSCGRANVAALVVCSSRAVGLYVICGRWCAPIAVLTWPAVLCSFDLPARLWGSTCHWLVTVCICEEEHEKNWLPTCSGSLSPWTDGHPACPTLCF